MVAITKCDKPSARPAEARQQLLREGVPLEEAGGTVQARTWGAHIGRGHRAQT